MAYTTTALVKTYLGISGAGDDTLLAQLVIAAQKAIDSYTDRTFEVASDTTRYYDAAGEHIRGGKLWLDADLCDITTVTNGDGVEVAASEYTTLPRNETPYRAIRLLGDSGKTWTYTDEWMDAIEITGKWGYSESAPADIAQAAIRMTAFLYRQKDAQMFDVTAIEAGTVIAPVGMPKDIQIILNHYRKLT